MPTPEAHSSHQDHDGRNVAVACSGRCHTPPRLSSPRPMHCTEVGGRALSRTLAGRGETSPYATMIKESIGPTMQTASKAVNTYGLADAVHSSLSYSTLW